MGAFRGADFIMHDFACQSNRISVKQIVLQH
jgi:hypothetical protein